jgi:diguanylate cyclase (GGDEF)-like protein
LEKTLLEKHLAMLERENRIIKKKLERSEANRGILEEALASHLELLKVCNAEIEESREIIRQSEARYRSLALYDSLTGLPSRVLFQERLSRAVAHAEKVNCLVALLFTDLDRFKTVNDTAGHETGDMVLKEAGERLVTCVRNEDTVARIGGDEFVVLLENIPDRQAAVRSTERILAVMSEPFLVRNSMLSVSASIGISLFPFDGEDIDTLLKNADAAMYSVKRRGRNGWGFYRKPKDTAMVDAGNDEPKIV